MVSRFDPRSRQIRDKVGNAKWRRVMRIGRECIVGGVEDVFEIAGKSAPISCIGGSGASSK